MKYLQRFAGILTAFCLMIILFFTSVEAVVYWNPGYFEKEYTKYQVLDDLPSMTMDDLLDVTSQCCDRCKEQSGSHTEGRRKECTQICF